jgi:hypothetical protein
MLPAAYAGGGKHVGHLPDKHSAPQLSTAFYANTMTRRRA